MDARQIAAVLLLATWFAVGGCAVWQKAEDVPPSELPNQRVSDETVTLEIARVALSSADELAIAAIWDEIDEQNLPLEKRRELDENGFRVGVISFHMPAPLRAIMSRSKGERGLNGSEMVRVDGEEMVAVNHRRFPRGKRGEYILVPARSELALLESENGILTGETYREAECKLILTAFPQNDGRVRIDVTPEIHHGIPRQHYAAGEGMLRIETRKERKVLEQVGFSATLQAGQTLILSGTEHLKGLGQAYFEREQGGTRRRQLLLIRLAGTQFDDLFQRRQVAEEKISLNEESTEDPLPSEFDQPTGD